MFQNEVVVLLEKYIVLTNYEIREQLHISQNQAAVLNTEIKRLCDKDIIRRIGRGVYSIVWNTKWGKIVPTEMEITRNFYIGNGEGYISGPAYYNAIGISSLIPNRKEITSNKYNYVLGNIVNVDIVRPRKTITKDNRWYLQLLDGIYNLPKNHCDVSNPLEIFASQIKKMELDEITLILMAKKMYPRFVLDMILEIEEGCHNDEVAFA
jgi:hypothetical protein